MRRRHGHTAACDDAVLRAGVPVWRRGVSQAQLSREHQERTSASAEAESAGAELAKVREELRAMGQTAEEDRSSNLAKMVRAHDELTATKQAEEDLKKRLAATSGERDEVRARTHARACAAIGRAR